VVIVVVPVTMRSVGTLNATPVPFVLFTVKPAILPVGDVAEFLKTPVPLMVWAFVDGEAALARTVCKASVPITVKVPLLTMLPATQTLVAASFLNSDPQLKVRSPPIIVPFPVAVAVLPIRLVPEPPFAVTCPSNNLAVLV